MPESQPSLWSAIHVNPANWGWGHVAALAGFVCVMVYVLSIHSARLAVGLTAVWLAGLAVPLVLVDSWQMIRKRARFHWTFAVVATTSAVSLTTLIWIGRESALALAAALSVALALLLLRTPRPESEAR